VKCIVIYFSQTGNTEKIARAIQGGIKQSAGHCDIVNLKDANPRRLFNYDLIGLGSLVLHFEEPGNVSAFISNMRFVGGKQCFVFSTHGTHPEYFFPSIVPKLKSKGLTVIGMHDWYAGCPFNARPYPTDGHPDDIDLNEANDFGIQMVELSRRISAGEIGLIPPPPPEPKISQNQVEEILHPAQLGKKELAFSYKDRVKFYKEKCNYPDCRLCMDNCPVDGIDLSMEPPVIAKPCISCEFCGRICPTGALADEPRPSGMRKSEVFRKFFLEPPGLIEAEAEGCFRRLVPKEKVGTDPPTQMKHPLWIIGKGLT
jgi:flavodoxin/ferredoxin